jgi:hypothetical protein
MMSDSGDRLPLSEQSSIERAGRALCALENERGREAVKQGVSPRFTELDYEEWREEYDEQARTVLAAAGSDLRICGVVSASGPNLEPLACGLKKGHDGPHSWASLPTFTAGALPVTEAMVLRAARAQWASIRRRAKRLKEPRAAFLRPWKEIEEGTRENLITDTRAGLTAALKDCCK